jgi:nicotinamide mononucleotide transporter
MKILNKVSKIINKSTVFWLLLSISLIALSRYALIPASITEVLGFISGALCVWLIVKQNIWNWPVGIINAVMFIVLFYQSQLYADMALQFIYIILGVFGWYWWLRGGDNNSALKIQSIGKVHALVLLTISVIATIAMRNYLVSIGDSAPTLDALTTVMSLSAQYMLTRKFIENWVVWIAADVIYIGLYTSRELYLTSILYAVFLSLCISGLIAWYKSRTQQSNLINSKEAES